MNDEEKKKTAELEDCLAGAREMGALMRNFFGVASLTLDWSKTLLGSVSSCLQSWRTTMSIVLASRFPMLIHWGAELAQFDNDGFRPILGDLKYPGAWRQPTYPWWAEIGEVLTPKNRLGLMGKETH